MKRSSNHDAWWRVPANRGTSFLAAALLGSGLAAGCTSEPPAEEHGAPPSAETPEAASPASHPLLDHAWVLTELGERVGPRGAGDRPATLAFDASANRASGFSGCNRFSAGYVLTADGLTFTAPISTKMACEGGMELEAAYLAALSASTTYVVTDSTLTISGTEGALATFRAAKAEEAAASEAPPAS